MEGLKKGDVVSMTAKLGSGLCCMALLVVESREDGATFERIYARREVDRRAWTRVNLSANECRHSLRGPVLSTSEWEAQHGGRLVDVTD